MPRSQPTGERARFGFFDSLRGFALLLMAVYHFCFDLKNSGVFAANFDHDPFWLGFRNLIMVLFTGLVGIGFGLGHVKYSSKSYQRRLMRLFVCAVMVSVVTYFSFGRSWIYFGILHFIFVVSLFAPLLNRFPVFCFFAGMGALLAPGFYRSPFFADVPLNILGLSPIKPFTEDFAPLLPWLGVTMLGVFLASLLMRTAMLKLKSEWAPLSVLGRHSLLFYMLHQLVLYPLALLISKAQHFA